MAKKNQTKKERLTIYLVKDVKLQDYQFIDTNRTKKAVELEIASGSAILYVKLPPPQKEPGWSHFLTRNQDVPDDLFQGSRSEGAILVFRCEEATFVLTFGMGFHLLDHDLVERDFGLRVALHSIDPDKLRSLDKASYEINPLNTRSQSPKDADIFDLHVDTETDMVYAITGASTEPIFGDQVTGRDALTIMPEVVLNDLPNVLSKALVRYKEKMPEKFSWIDDVNRVKDKETLEILDLQLSGMLAGQQPIGDVWLGEPEIVDWEMQAGYSFDLRRRTAIHQTLRLSELLGYIAARGETPSTDVLRKQSVHIIDGNQQPIGKWTAYRCLYAEYPDGEHTYVLRNGVWYAISSNFVERVDKALVSLGSGNLGMPVYMHADEGSYNSNVASTVPGYVLMDKKNVHVGGPYDKIEFCDLVRDRRDLIHVKFYRNSATLSHLFAQGCASAETFMRHEDFRVKLNEKLPDAVKLENPYARPVAEEYRVVYAIATTKDIPRGLPFFSKVTLKNALSTLNALRFGVVLTNIEIEGVFLKTKYYRSQRKVGSVVGVKKSHKKKRLVNREVQEEVELEFESIKTSSLLGS
ncbi:TIGR04141 family sporadically distributed protein [Ralstonia solanacearum]|uniref:TIGR04141 family sporadically distributed protein n=1 Tax=Ralstonia solanacearum TaxID=305 RepID=UPI0018D1B809|nr:TIGR04141 family sporadically distributed protein [Ralstonia solanacearum]